MRRALLLAIALALTCAPNATAASKAPAPPISLLPLSPSIATNFTGGDQISQLFTSAGNIFLVGTVETSTSPLVITAPLGGSDGFITALNSQGGRAWDLRLGSAGDDVATAGCLDDQGNIWIVGSSAISIDVGAVPGLHRLTVWEVSAAGTLLNTFTKDLTDIDVPTSIAIKGANFIVQGVSNKVGLPTFALTLTPLGAIGPVKNTTSKPAAAAQLFNASSAAYAWQSFSSTKPVKGVAGVVSGQSINYLLKNSLKDKSLKGAYSIQGAPLALQYQSGIGVILVSQGGGSYFLTILHTK